MRLLICQIIFIFQISEKVIQRFSQHLYDWLQEDAKQCCSATKLYFTPYAHSCWSTICAMSKIGRCGDTALFGVFLDTNIKFLRNLCTIFLYIFQGWLNVGNKHRATASTAMNDKSSRSHSVFTMVLTQTMVFHLIHLILHFCFSHIHYTY